MENLKNYLKQNLKLAYKTVTFHFKQYLCFFVGLFIIEVLFGIIVMSASNAMSLETDMTEESYDYHICIIGVNEAQYEYLEKLRTLDYDPNEYEGKITPPPAIGMYKVLEYVREESRQKGNSTVYDIYYLFEDDNGTSTEDLYKKFQKLYQSDLRNLGKAKVQTELSPLYHLPERLGDIRTECIVWLLLLAGVSVIVLILLYNIRVNHFKFTYGIYMSFGADTKRLFATCFWEVLVISVLTLIPAAVTATIADFLFFNLAGYAYTFAPYLMLLAVLYMIPIVMISVYVPVKATAVRPPLKLLLAEDNSNLVSSPKVSVQMLGKSFPGGYEKITLRRFGKYNIQLMMSSVIFAVLFVCTSFYCGIYSYNTERQTPEFVIDFNQHEVVTKVPTVERGEEVTEFNSVRRALYTDDAYLQMGVKGSAVSAFEAYYDAENYTFTKTEAGRKFIDNSTGNEVTSDYHNAMDKVLKSDYSEADLEQLEKYLDVNSYIQQRNKNGYVTEIYVKKIVEIEHIRYEGDTYTEEIGEELNSVLGVKYTYKSCVTTASSINSHILFNTQDTKVTSGFYIHPKMENTDVTMSAAYSAADKEVLDYIDEHFRYRGDIYALLDNKNSAEKQIIISDSINNQGVLNISVGDTVQIAKFKSYIKTPSKDDHLEGDQMLQFLLNNAKFEYETYKVCAVVENMSSGSNMSVFMTGDDYKTLTKNEPLYKQVSVYVDPTLSKEAINSLSREIREWANGYSDTEVTWLNAISEGSMERAMRKLPLFKTIAGMLLFISPLFWFFSQIMFYKKREKEFELLRGIGALESEIKKLFLIDGAFFAAIGAVITAVLSTVGVLIMYAMTQKIMTVSADTSTIRYVFEMPWASFAIAIVSTAAFAFFASYLPYLIDKKNMQNKSLSEFSGE